MSAARVGREQLPLGRAQEDRERRRPAAEQLHDLRPVACGAPPPRPRRPSRGRWRCASRSATRSSSSRTRARMRKRKASRSCVSSTPSWRTTSSGAPSSSSTQLAQRVAVERREEQVADADVELDDLDLGLARRRGGRLVVLDEERADEAAAEVGEREALRLEAVVRRRRAPTTKSTSDRSGFRRSTVSAVMRAPTMIENAKKRSPTISQSAWKRADPLADALEPAVGADGVELELARFGLRSSADGGSRLARDVRSKRRRLCRARRASGCTRA